jgi:hypothetical protein
MNRNRCYDQKNKLWRVNRYDGKGWVPEETVTSAQPSNSRKLLARVSELRTRLAREKEREYVNEVWDRQEQTASVNARFLLR